MERRETSFYPNDFAHGSHLLAERNLTLSASISGRCDYNIHMKILFLHGWQSVPGGVKPTYLKDHGHMVINPKLPDEDFDEAVRIAQAEFNKHQPQAVVGSSRGGAVAMNIDSGDARLVLLCPAWKKWGMARTVKPNTYILHSRADDVIPFADSEELVRNSGLPVYVLTEVGSDHRLADPESLDLMLAACSSEDDDEPIEDEEEDILEKDWTGLCYTAALKWCRNAEETDWTLVHGTVLSNNEKMRIDHAWCERGEFVVDLARPIGARIMERDVYYRLAKPEITKTYSAEDASWLAIRNKHDGPWDDAEQLDK